MPMPPRPGGVDTATMKELVNRVRQGTPAEQIPMLEQWNYQVMRAVLREYMAAQEFLAYPPPVQSQLQMLWQMLEEAEQRQALIQTMRQAKVQAGMMQIQAPLAMAGAQLQGQAAGASAPPEPPPSASPSSSSGD